jgi:hypothetical protein
MGYPMNSRVLFLLPLIAFELAGCSSFTDALTNRTASAGPKPIIVEYEQIDLVHLLDPQHYAETTVGSTWGTLTPGQQIDLAFAAFHTKYPGEPERKRRDEIQERMLGASNQMCSRYLAYLQTINSNGNFVLGSLATVAGAAGALVTGGASQALSAAAGALSGVRAEFNQDYFSNLTVAVIASGIKLDRQEVYDQIARYGQQNDVDKYSVEAAVKDALYYHGECSLIAGVEKAGDSVKLAADPGLDAVNRVLLKLNIAKSLAQSGSTDPSKLLGSGGIGASGLLLMAGTARTEPSALEQGAGDLPLTELINVTNSVQDTVKSLTARVGGLAHFQDKATADSVTTAITTAGTAVLGSISKCQTDATTASTAIVNASATLAAATDDVKKANAAQTLNLAVLQGQQVTFKMKSAAAAFADQTGSAIDTLSKADADADAKTPKVSIPPSTVSDAVKAINATGQLTVGCSG